MEDLQRLRAVEVAIEALDARVHDQHENHQLAVEKIMQAIRDTHERLYSNGTGVMSRLTRVESECQHCQAMIQGDRARRWQLNLLLVSVLASLAIGLFSLWR